MATGSPWRAVLALILLETVSLLTPTPASAQAFTIQTIILTVGGRVLEVATTEVTQAQYRYVTGLSPSLARGDELPVDSVSWYDAVSFCNQLSAAQGLEPVYDANGADRSRAGWRLPTEEEWEVLAAAGPSGPSSAWYINNSEQHTHPVSGLAPNALGLFDLFGNVWEWCDSERPGDLKADHGGGFRSSASLLNTSAKGLQGAGSWADDLGFRIVRTIQGAPASSLSSQR